MQHKNIVKMGALLITLGVIALFGFQANSQTVRVSSFIESIEGRLPTPDTSPEEYSGTQTVNGLMNAFDAAYNQRYSKARVIALCEDGTVYSSELAISGEIDARYPRAEWLQMLLQRGITIEDFDDYRVYLSKRHTLAFLEDNPNLRKIKLPNIPPTDNWEIYKVAYMDKLASKQVEHIKKQLERAKKQIERAKQRIEHAKKQFKSQQLQQLKHNQVQLERAKKQLEEARKQFKRLQGDLEQPPTPKPFPNKLEQNIKRTSPYPPL